MLNRVVRWTADGLEYEADPRQCEKLLRDLKFDGEDVKSAGIPGAKRFASNLTTTAHSHTPSGRPTEQ